MGASGSAGAIGGAALGFMGQRQANETNLDIARETRSYGTYMSNTAHQREVEDLRSAGLNPILSANAGASTPSAPTATMQSTIGAGLTAAADIARLSKEVQQADADIGLKQAQGIANIAASKRDASAAKQYDLNSKVMEGTMDSVLSKAKTDKMQQEFNQKYMKFDNFTNRALRGLQVGNSAKDLVNPLKGLLGDRVKKVKVSPQTEQSLISIQEKFHE